MNPSSNSISVLQSYPGDSIAVISSSPLQLSLTKNGACTAALSPQEEQDISSTPTSTWLSPSVLQNTSSLFSDRVSFRQSAPWRDHLVSCAEASGKKVSDFSLSPPPSPSGFRADIDIERIEKELDTHQHILRRRLEDYGEEGLDSRCGFTPEPVRERYRQHMEEVERSMNEPSEEDEELLTPSKNSHVQSSPLYNKRRADGDSTASEGKPTKKRKVMDQDTIPNNERLRKKRKEYDDQFCSLFSEERDSGDDTSAHPEKRLERSTPPEPMPLFHILFDLKPDCTEGARAELKDRFGSSRRKRKNVKKTQKSSSLQHSNHNRAPTAAHT